MAQPPTYNRQYSFTSYQTSNPSDPLPASQVEIELNKIKETLDALLNNIALIQRDDGEIANDSVGLDQLSLSLSAGFDRPVAWDPGTNYLSTSTVFYEGKFYSAKTAFTSGSTFDSANWNELADFTQLNVDPGYIWLFDDDTSSSRAGEGYVKFDNADPGAASTMYISATGAAGDDIGNYVRQWDKADNPNKGYLLIKKQGAVGNNAVLVVTDITDQTTDFTISLRSSLGSSAGTFTAEDELVVVFAPAGEQGITPGTRWELDKASTDTSSDPGTAKWRANSGTLASATELAVNNSADETGNPNFSSVIAQWGNSPASPKGYLHIQDAADGSKRIEYKVTNIVAESGFYRFTVADGASVGTFSDGDSTSLQFIPNPEIDTDTLMSYDFANASTSLPLDLLDSVITAGLIKIGTPIPWPFSTLPSSDYVYLDGGTVGNAASGADDADDDYEDFFDLCKAEAQLGNTGSEDFSAGDTVVKPDWRGRIPIGLDKFSGGSAANRIQHTANLTTTSGSATATVSDATGLVKGMYVFGDGVAAGTTINSFSGTTVTLSANATESSTNSTRFSLVNDPEALCATGGADVIALILAQLAAHSHGAGSLSWSGSVSGTVENHDHGDNFSLTGSTSQIARNLSYSTKNLDTPGNNDSLLDGFTIHETNLGLSGSVNKYQPSWSGSVSGSISDSTGSSGSDQAHSNLPPVSTVNWVALAKTSATDNLIPLGLGTRFYKYSSSVTEEAPGDGKIRFDNTDLSAATECYIDDDDAEGNDLSSLLTLIGDSTSSSKGEFQITNITQRGKFAVFSVDAAASDQVGYVKLTLTYISGNGADSFALDDQCAINEWRKGDKGDQGVAVDAGVGFDFDDTTTMADPGTGNLRLNNASFASVTAAAVSASSRESGNPDVSDFIASFDDSSNTSSKGFLVIKKSTGAENFAIYSVTGNVTDNSTWLQLTLTHIASSGSFSAGDQLSVEFHRAGDKGDTGTAAASNFTKVRVVCVANVDITLELEDADTQDGVTLATGDLVLLTGQTDATENGVYVVPASGAAARDSNFDTYDEVAGAYFVVMEGTAYKDTLWKCTSDYGGTIETNDLTIVRTGADALTHQRFTSSGTWNRPAGCKKVRITVVGGGGGGGSGDQGASTSGCGGGGGAGEARITYLDVSGISSSTITIGAGGSGGAATGANSGSSGGTSSWADGTNTITANGGSGGAANSGGGASTASGGAGGSGGSGGDYRVGGSGGSPGFFNNNNNMALGGSGGGSLLGGGGGGVSHTNAGQDGAANSGSGGGGGAARNGASDVAGGDGADGVIVVEEYY